MILYSKFYRSKVIVIKVTKESYFDYLLLLMTTQLQGFPNCGMQGRSRWYDRVNKIGSKTSDEESTNESCIFMTH